MKEFDLPFPIAIVLQPFFQLSLFFRNRKSSSTLLHYITVVFRNLKSSSSLLHYITVKYLTTQCISFQEWSLPSSYSILPDLQTVFGHLQESKLQYYTPDTFWKNFKLYGQPINVREQRDALEFFNDLIDQVDEILKVFYKE